MKIVISSGHGLYVRGASGYVDEVDEARKVVEQTARILDAAGVEVVMGHDDVSTTQSENLDRIVKFHNAQGPHDLDVSVHFNAFETTEKPMGAEVLYASSAGLRIAESVVNAICTSAGLLNRGPKERTDLAFLNGTNETAVLIETCFCDSKADTDIYHQKFDTICAAIAAGLVEHELDQAPSPDEAAALFYAVGKCSMFGGPDDTGVSPSEGLAFVYAVDEAPQLFLPFQPSGTSGLARRLNPYTHYLACRWDYDVTSRDLLKSKVALVRSIRTGVALQAFPADWGPHQDTGRVADLSPCLMTDLELTTDDEVEIIFPWEP